MNVWHATLVACFTSVCIACSVSVVYTSVSTCRNPEASDG